MDEFDLDVTPELEKIGYQMTEEFTLPDEYMQEQPEVEAVEYDMDEQDAFFMDMITEEWPSNKYSGVKASGESDGESGQSGAVSSPVKPSSPAAHSPPTYNADGQLILRGYTPQPSQGPFPPTHEMFEYVVTLIERLWFSLASSMPPKPPQTHDEMDSLDDQACCICGESECDNSNAIVYCDGCDMACHQECYGVTHIPEGQWLCRKCSFSRARRRNKKGNCIFCPSQVGAFKMTTQKNWGHVICALWLPEIKIGGRNMEPISHVRDIPRSRWKLHCYICKQRMGACIQCARGSCVQAFHVTCARRAGLQMEMIHGVQGAMFDPGSMRAYCHNHGGDEDTLVRIKALRKWFAERYDGKGRRKPIEDVATTESSELGSEAPTPGGGDGDGTMSAETPGEVRTPGGGSGDGDITMSQTPQPATPYGEDFATPEADQTIVTEVYPTWKTPAGTPLLPKLIIDRICEALEPFNISHCRKFVTMVARYWALKREFKRGAALIKRLNIALENSQAVASTQLESLEDRQKRYRDTIVMINELERIKVRVELLAEREAIKLDYLKVQGDLIRTLLLPVTALCLKLCDQMTEQDSNGYFLEIPEIPGYREVVECPMSMTEIREKTLNLEYNHVAQMLPDFEVMYDNAFVYNDSEAPVCVEADRLRGVVRKLVEEYTEKEKLSEYQRCFADGGEEGKEVREAQKRPFVAME
ncbi:NuA3 HAT complex component NTO1 [Yarrowia sp. C11]|nr:NuA3 HAT complex component NTO1 [Yarrowia sp. E02]KAG5367814.1 NuA3 HAT complex component NTO1 [Yarrowia sp. C11]